MTDSDAAETNEVQLWRQFSRASKAPGACPDALALAAYLEGRADRSETAAIETHLAACPRCVAEARELRELLSAPMVPAPPEMRAKAKALVSGRRVAVTRRASRLVRRAASGWHAAWRWVGAALLALTVSGVGYGLGREEACARQRGARQLSADAASWTELQCLSKSEVNGWLMPMKGDSE